MTEDRAAYLDQSEADFMAGVLEAAGYLGWYRYHSHDSRRDNEVAGVDPGFPDLVLLQKVPPEGRQARCLFVELKSRKGRISPEQRGWLDAALRAGGIEVYVWRPSDMDRVMEVLRG